MSNHDREGPQSRNHGAAPDAVQDAAQVEALKRAWRQASDEQPPPGADATIIAAAHNAVQDRGAGEPAIDTGPRARNRWIRWQPLAAAAGVAGLAFILVQLMPSDRDVAPSIRLEAPSRGPATAEDKQTTSAPPAAAPRATAEETQDAITPAATVPQTTGEATDAAAKARDSAAEGASVTHATEADQRGAVAPEMSSPAAPAAAAAPARERSLDNAAPPSAADWALRIAALHASGDVAGAADELRAFRRVEPDADTYLPDSLRNWARAVK